jgi:hypothetical protein
LITFSRSNSWQRADHFTSGKFLAIEGNFAQEQRLILSHDEKDDLIASAQGFT